MELNLIFIVLIFINLFFYNYVIDMKYSLIINLFKNYNKNYEDWHMVYLI